MCRAERLSLPLYLSIQSFTHNNTNIDDLGSFLLRTTDVICDYYRRMSHISIMLYVFVSDCD